MMHSFAPISWAILAYLTSALATPTLPIAPAYTCTSFFVPLKVNNVTAIVLPFKYPFPNGYAATAFANLLTSRDAAASTGKPKLLSVTETFNISVEYSTLKSAGLKASTVQLLTHGLGFDKSYWDFKLPCAKNTTQYSYIRTALTFSYSTLSWDRLGCGASTAADPYNEIRATVELCLLTELTTALREGKLSVHIPKPQKVIHIGHSWGSQLTNALAASSEAANLTDGVVLTGYSHISTYQPLFLASTNFHLASTNQSKRFHNRSSGYLTWGDQ